VRAVGRHAYLEALGIDTYVPRRQPPGAAPSRCVGATGTPAPAASASASGESRGHRNALLRDSPGVSPPPAPVLDDMADGKAGSAPAPVAAVPAAACRLNLAVICAGRWLWLEDLEGRPLATEQVQLLRAMAYALAFAGGAGPPEAGISHFDWPVHNNRQLDNSEAAAKASLTAFLERRLQRGGCDGIVLLGEACQSLVSTETLNVPVVATVSTAQMLARPALKRRAWIDLQRLRGVSPSQ